MYIKHLDTANWYIVSRPIAQATHVATPQITSSGQCLPPPPPLPPKKYIEDKRMFVQWAAQHETSPPSPSLHFCIASYTVKHTSFNVSVSDCNMESNKSHGTYNYSPQICPFALPVIRLLWAGKHSSTGCCRTQALKRPDDCTPTMRVHYRVAASGPLEDTPSWKPAWPEMTSLEKVRNARWSPLCSRTPAGTQSACPLYLWNLPHCQCDAAMANPAIPRRLISPDDPPCQPVT